MRARIWFRANNRKSKAVLFFFDGLDVVVVVLFIIGIDYYIIYRAMIIRLAYVVFNNIVDFFLEQ